MDRRSTTAYNKKDAARNRALAAKQGMITGAEEDLASFEAGAADRQKQIRFGAARGLAAGAGAGGMSAGGGFLGAAGQAGLEAEMAGIRQQTAEEQTRRSLRGAIDEAKVGEAEYAATAGSREEDYVIALADAESAIEQAITSNRGWINDDEDAMNSAVRSEIAKLRARHPAAAKELEDKYLKEGGEGYKQIYD